MNILADEQKELYDKNTTKEELEKLKKELTGYSSIDEPWMINYQQNAREIALDMEKGKNISTVILDSFEKNKDVDALRYFNRKISRDELKEQVEIWAKAFRCLGVEEKEVVPLYGTFFPDVCAMILALNQIGAVIYPVKLNISKKDLEKETENSKIAIVYDGMWNNVKDVFSDDRFKKIIAVNAADGILPPLEQIVRFKGYLDAIKSNSRMPNTKKYVHSKDILDYAKSYSGEYKAKYEPNQVAFITSSSGSTINGEVKGIMSTNEAAISQLAKCVAAELPFYKGENCLTNLPPTASTAMFCLYLLPLYKGMTIIDEPRLSAENYYKQIMKYKPQIALMTGSFWKVFIRCLEDEINKGKIPDLSFFRMPIIGGEGVTPRQFEKMNNLIQKYGSNVSFFSGSGLSEYFSVSNVQKDDVRYLENHTKPVITVGLPLPTTKAGVFDENGNELKYNERGELWLKDKDVVMRGYYGKEHLTSKVIDKNGWLHTGDLAEIDENGFIYLYGRMNDKVKINGEDIYLFDIANKIREDKEIDDVIVFAYKQKDNSYSFVAHIILEENCKCDIKSKLLEIDEKIKNTYNDIIKIDGYKIHNTSFVISPTTAKVDRNTMYNDRSNFIKYIDDKEYRISFDELDNCIYKDLVEEHKLVKRR